jgi:C4-dicarboxylate-specific signal transduction histidine kinase
MSDPRKHLLVVDDEPIILQILKAVFEEEPYRLTLCSTGADAARVIDAEQVDLLLTDKNLPDIGGLELLAKAKAKDPLAEVIIVTGYASLETALSAMELDVFDYVLKPLNNVFDIRKKVRQAFAKQDVALENRRLIVELREKNAALEAALDEARSLQDELIQSEKLAGIGTLAAGIAHEISSPLFGVMGLAQAIADESEIALAQAYARDILESCRTMRDIVVELTNYSRTATDEFRAEVDLGRVVHEAIRLVERTCNAERVAIECAIEDGIMLHARTNEMQQVFVNLVKNAVEAVQDQGEPAPWVRIAGGVGTGHCWVTVTDNGPGIPADKVKLIFDPFYTTKPPGKGTGLGLNIVYRIVAKYRGTIHVTSGESSPGGGDSAQGRTAFEVRLPLDR